MKSKTTPLIRICDRIIEKCKRSGIKRYSSKFDNRIYDNYQFIVLLCLKQKAQCGYKAFIEEELVEWLHIVEHLGLETIPHYTALQKFAQRIKQSILELVLLQSIARMNVKKLVLGQDGTGFKSKKISCHYIARIEYFTRQNAKKRKPGRPRKKKRKRKYLYVQIMVELRTQMPLGILITRSPGGDAKKFKPVVKKVMKLGKEIKYVTLDKGYDDETVHEFIRECLMAESIIPARNENVPIHRTSGRYRKKMKQGYSKKKYHQRSKNETVNSVVKRKWGDSTLALNWRNQNKEIIFRLIFYAARRFTSIVFLCFLRNIIIPRTKEETIDFIEEGFL
jgi:transposase